MRLKINEGHSFLHPVTGEMIGPGQFYNDYEVQNNSVEETEKENETKENVIIEEKQDSEESTGGEIDGQGETNKENPKGNRRQRRTSDDK